MSGHTVHVHYPLHQSDNCIRGREKLKTSFQLSLEITYSALIKNHQPRKLDNNTGLINLQKYTKKCEYMSSKVWKTAYLSLQHAFLFPLLLE